MTNADTAGQHRGGWKLAAVAALLAALAPARLDAQCPSGTPPPCTRPTAASAASVAVLYFNNRSSDSTDEYLADAMTEEVITRLVTVERLEVKSRTAVERFRGRAVPPDSLGRALNVAHLVSGTVQRSGNRLRVSVELIRAPTGVTVWAGRFDRSDTDLLDIQAAIADSVAQAVAGRLLPRERGALVARATRNPQAWDRFMRGSYRLSRRTAADVQLAIREFELAVRLEPSFAAAHARIALAYGVALDWGWKEFDVQRSIRVGLAASSRALELDSMLADAWTARGYVLRFANARTYAGVHDAFDRAIRLAPRDAEARLQYGWALANMGSTDAAIRTLQRAVELDPERAITRFTIAWVLVIMHRPREAIAHLDTALNGDPTVPNLRAIRSWARLMVGDTAGARADIASEQYDRRLALSALAAIQAASGDSSAARRTADDLVRDLPPAPARLTWGAGWQAGALAATRQTERVMAILERIDSQGLTVWWMTQWPAFEPIRRDSAFARFVAELAPSQNH